jgi:hypothetical protein
MKKMFLMMTVMFAFSFAALAQEPKPAPPAPEQKAVTECVILKEGKVLHYLDGKTMPVDKEMDFKGIKVAPDGTLTLNDGTAIKLKEGQCCDGEGKIHNDCVKLLKKG